MTNSTLLATPAMAAQDLDLLEFQSVLLFVSRVAFDLLVTQILFSHPWAEVCVVCTGAFMVVCSAAWGFGTQLSGFMLVKILTILSGRVFMIIVRMSNLYMPNGISRQKQDWVGYVLGFLLALNMLEAGLSQAKQGYPGGLFISIALACPWFCLPRPRSFLIRPPTMPSSNYFFAMSWPWIIAYTLWNIEFTIMQERGEPNMTWDTVLANAAGLTADFINCIRIHPGAWIHSRAHTLMWTLLFGVANQDRPMVSNVLSDKRVENPAAYVVDAGISVICVAFMALHVWCLFRPKPIASKQWLFGKIPGSVFAGFIPVDDDVTEHLLQATIAPVCGCNSHLQHEIKHGKHKGSATVVVNPANGEHVPSPMPQALNDDGTPKAPHEDEGAANGHQIDDFGESDKSRTSEVGIAEAASNCCSPFAPLKKVVLLGDSCDPEEMKFGNQLERTSLGAFALKKAGQWPMLMFRTLIMATGPLIVMICFASVPCHLDKDVTPLSASTFGFINMICALCTTCSPLLMSAHHHNADIVKWACVTFGILPILGGLAQYKLNDMGKSSKGYSTQALLMPAGVMVSMAIGKVNLNPGWTPKWNTGCGVCKGANKAVASMGAAAFIAFISGIVLITFIRQDTLSLSENKSKSMIVIRPTIFFVVKKMVYHAFACFSRFRHPVVTKATNIGASVMLGIATAILFTNTRAWLDLIFFIAGNWFTWFSKLWTLFGSKGSDKAKILHLYSWFMSTGKPIVAPNINKVQLRGFEIQAQNFGTTYGLVVIIAFYPIAAFYFGRESMIYKLLFATENSLSFLLVALGNEIIEDNLGQLCIGRLTDNDFSRLYSVFPSQEMKLGLIMNTVFGSVICSSGFMYRATKVGPFKEVA